MDAVQGILCNLYFGSGDDRVGEQVMGHLDGLDTVRPVLRTLALLSQDWPDAEAHFRWLVVENIDEWLDEVAKMPVAERLGAALTTMWAFGGPPPEVLAQVEVLAAMAERELERRGIGPIRPL